MAPTGTLGSFLVTRAIRNLDHMTVPTDNRHHSRCSLVLVDQSTERIASPQSPAEVASRSGGLLGLYGVKRRRGRSGHLLADPLMGAVTVVMAQ